MLPVSADSEEGREMMNQVTNLIQWKNLTQEQQDEFDSSYTYEYQKEHSSDWVIALNPDFSDFCGELVFRLVIKDDKWYYWVWEGESFIKLGSQVVEMHRGGYSTIRPARPNEIPHKEENTTNFQLVYDPVTGNTGPKPDKANDYREHHGSVAWLWNPYNGHERDPRDIGSDPTGLLCVPIQGIPVAKEKTLEQKIQDGDNREALQECLKNLDRVSHLLGILFEAKK